MQLLKACFFDRKVDELDKTIAVAAKDPALYGIDGMELEKRRRWTSNAHTQVCFRDIDCLKKYSIDPSFLFDLLVFFWV